MIAPKDLSMEAMREDVKNLCKIQILCLQNLSEYKKEEQILEALTGAYIAGITKGMNIVEEIGKE